jgi:hypothetical protein
MAIKSSRPIDAYFKNTIDALSRFAEDSQKTREVQPGRTLLRITEVDVAGAGAGTKLCLQAVPESSMTWGEWFLSLLGTGNYKLFNIIQFLESDEFTKDLKNNSLTIEQKKALKANLEALKQKVDKYNKSLFSSPLIDLGLFNEKVMSVFETIYPLEGVKSFEEVSSKSNKVKGKSSQEQEGYSALSKSLAEFITKVESAKLSRISDIDTLRRELRSIQHKLESNGSTQLITESRNLDQLLDTLQASIQLMIQPPPKVLVKLEAGRIRETVRTDKGDQVNGLIIRQKDDGSCLYHSFSEGLHRLNPTEHIYTAEELREITASRIEKIMKGKEEEGGDRLKAINLKQFIRNEIEDKNIVLRNRLKKDTEEKFKGLALQQHEFSGSIRVKLQPIFTKLEKLKAKPQEEDNLQLLDQIKAEVMKASLEYQLETAGKGKKNEIKKIHEKLQGLKTIEDLEKVQSELNKLKVPSRYGVAAQLHAFIDQFDQAKDGIKKQNVEVREQFINLEDQGQEQTAIDSYIQKIRHDTRFWGSYPEIEALRDYFKLNVIVSYNDGLVRKTYDDAMAKFPDLQNANGKIHLDYENGSHYNLYLDLPPSQAKLWKKS